VPHFLLSALFADIYLVSLTITLDIHCDEKLIFLVFRQILAVAKNISNTCCRCSSWYIWIFGLYSPFHKLSSKYLFLGRSLFPFPVGLWYSANYGNLEFFLHYFVFLIITRVSRSYCWPYCDNTVCSTPVSVQWTVSEYVNEVRFHIHINRSYTDSNQN
jgi:hypothetical protein